MMNAANEKGLAEAAVFAITMYCVQGFAGYPLTAVCLQLEGKKLLKGYRSGELKAENAAGGVDAVNGKLENAPPRPRRSCCPAAR